MVPRTGERPKTIVLVGDLGKYHREGRATQTGIYPGMMVEPTSTNTDVPHTPPTIQKHSTAGGDDIVRIVKEDYLQGKTINDAYSNGGVVLFHEAQRGDVVFARVASGTHWTVGTKLGSAGSGLFAASGTKRVLQVMEDYDGTADTTHSLIRCEVL